MRKCIFLFLIAVSSLPVYAQLVVNMKMPIQSAEPLRVAALFSEGIQAGYPVVLGIIGYSIEGGVEPYMYTWLKDNLEIGSGQTIVVTPVEGSSYSLRVTDKSNCVVSHALNVSALKKVRKQEQNTLKAKIYPTLVSTEINVEVSEFLPPQSRIKIFDFKGNLMLNQELIGNATIYPQLPAGNYFVVIEAADRYFVERVIVNN